jgi:porin
MITDHGGAFINSAFGWPSIAAVNLPNGGVAYPLSTPGARLELSPADNLTFRAGVYNDDPSGPCRVDAQLCNHNGLEFRIGDAPFVIAEAALTYGAERSPLLPGTIKIGGWKDYGNFDDQRFGSDGLLLADPASDGDPLEHDGNHGVYAVVDQMLWQPAGSSGYIAMFLRAMGAPSDRNLVDFSFDGGVIFAGLIPHRPNDSFGIGAAVAGISGDARASDRDAQAIGSAPPVRADEVLLEAVYTAELTPGWIVQPDFQYVWRPGGNAADDSGTRPLGDAAVFGVRTTLEF